MEAPRPSLTARLIGAVVGHLVGDAVGVPYEFLDADEITTVELRGFGTHSQPPGTWSDDGALMLALLDSLLRDRRPGEPVFDTADQARRVLAWADEGAYTPDGDGKFDIGGATAAALARLRAGVPAEEAGGTAERDNGNGSLMRILPLALVERDVDDATLIDHAHRASAVTHGHPIAQATCALYVLVARRLLDGSARAPALAGARATLRTAYATAIDADVRLAALDAIEAWPGRSGRGYVIDSLWSAWEAFAGAASYRETIERAIRYGGDTDTTACIAGGLAGLRFGFAGIPDPWVAGMRGASILQPLIARLTRNAEALTPTTDGARAATPPDARTSATHPIRVDWLDLSSVPGLAAAPGRLGMTFLPGKRDLASPRRHWRDLDADVVRLREHHGIDGFVLLVEDHELDHLSVPTLIDALTARGIEVLRMPIVDGGVPEDTSAFRELLAEIPRRIERGERVAVACRGGLGRTGTVIALILRGLALDAPTAIELTRATRANTIENARQEAFVATWRPTPADDDALPSR